MNLETVGIKPELQYECIYTTISASGEKNAAAIGFKYLGDGKVKCNIFDGSKTLKNIQDTKQYVVNITQDPLTFVYSTISNLPEDYFTDDEKIAILKDAGSYLIIDVTEINEKQPSEFPIKSEKSIFEITGQITEFVVNNKSEKAFNRGMGCLIDSLVNYTRYHIVDSGKKALFDRRLEENQRIINKVSDSETMKAIDILKKNQEK